MFDALIKALRTTQCDLWILVGCLALVIVGFSSVMIIRHRWWKKRFYTEQEYSNTKIRSVLLKSETDIRTVHEETAATIQQVQKQAANDVAAEKEHSRKTLISAREQIQTDKNTLVLATEKDLLVQTVMALGGYGSRLDRMETSIIDLSHKAQQQKEGVVTLHSSLDAVNNSIRHSALMSERIQTPPRRY